MSPTGDSFLDLFLSVDNGMLSTRIYDKRDSFDFHIVNFPFLDGNIPKRPAYGVYVSQLVRYARACTHYHDVCARHELLVKRLLSQGYLSDELRRTFKSFWKKYPDLTGKYSVLLQDHLKRCFPCEQ